MNRPLVSIIVVIFNAERYLCRCLDSLISQTYQNIEILLINDGSKDKSGEICDSYAKKDNRIVAIHKENGGVASARQLGLKISKGEYLIHIDPDDWIERTMIQELLNKIQNDNVDIVMCDFIRESNFGTSLFKQKPTSLDRDTLLLDLLNSVFWGSCCNKLVSRKCFSKYDIDFNPKMNLWEDLYVITKIIYEGGSLSYLPLPLYHYDCSTNENSIVRKPKLSHIFSMKIYIDDFEKVLNNKKFEEGFYYRKFLLKRRCFRTGKKNKDIFISIFSEFNNRFIEENSFRWSDLRSYRGDILKMEKICMAMVLKRKTNFGYDLFQFWNRYATKSLRSFLS